VTFEITKVNSFGEDVNTGAAAASEDVLLFGALVFVSLFVFTVVELAALYLFLLRFSMRISLAAGLRLTPLNRQRARICRFLSAGT